MSQTRAGGTLADNLRFGGYWSPTQQNWHSNQKELWPVYEVLNRLGSMLEGQSVKRSLYNEREKHEIINLTPKSYKVTGTLPTSELSHHSSIYTRPIQRLADSLSRSKALPEWHLMKDAVENIFQKLGRPEIDLFASSRSAVVPAYVSENSADTNSQFTNAFSRTWRYKLGWIFPPPAMIPQVLRHLESSEGFYLLITSTWSRAFWEPQLRRRAMGPSLRIENLKSNLIDLRTNLPPPEIDRLHLVVWDVRAGQMN